MSNFFTPFLNFPRYVGTHDLCTNTRDNFSENYRKIYGIIQERRKKIFIFLTDGQFPLALRFLNLQKSYRTKVLTIFFRSSKIFLLIKNTITLGMLLIIMWPIWWSCGRWRHCIARKGEIFRIFSPKMAKKWPFLTQKRPIKFYKSHEFAWIGLLSS